MNWPCPRPEFPFDSTRQCWLHCVRCGRLAWDHEQADPLADLRAYVRQIQQHGNPIPAEQPPTMRPWPDA